MLFTAGGPAALLAYERARQDYKTLTPPVEHVQSRAETMSHATAERRQSPCFIDAPDGVAAAHENLNRKISGLKAKVFELGKLATQPWTEEDTPTVYDAFACRQRLEAERCAQQLTNAKMFFLAEIKELEQNFKLQVQAQKSENLRFKQMLMEIKAEKSAFHHQLLLLQRKVEKFESDIGRD